MSNRTFDKLIKVLIPFGLAAVMVVTFKFLIYIITERNPQTETEEQAGVRDSAADTAVTAPAKTEAIDSAVYERRTADTIPLLNEKQAGRL